MSRLLGISLLLLAGPALAHAPVGGAAWRPDLWALLGLGAAAALYAGGVARLWRRAGRGRGVAPWRVLSGAAGFALMGVLLVSPFDALATRYLSAHMVQHFGLMLVAAPLVVLGRAGLMALWAVPPRPRLALAWIGRGATGRIWGALTRPAGAWAVYFVILWLWHVPALHQRALSHDGLHALQHISFVAAALIFWTAVLERPRDEGHAGALIAVFATALHSAALAALLTTSRSLWYPAYAGGLADQQLAGLIMWVPCGAVLIGAALLILVRLLRDAETRARRATQ